MSQAKMEKSPSIQLQPPRYETGKALRLAGLKDRYTTETMRNIPQLWNQFAPHIGRIPGQVGHVAYGVSLHTTDCAKGFEYLAAVEVSQVSGLPAGFSTLELRAQRYAVFAHNEHVARLCETLDVIGRKWLPESGIPTPRRAEGAPDFFERYSEEFNPQTGMGGMEVWLPIES
jgi:AraC family transcriptional regulator